jgi:hypothetical protein
MVAWLAAVALVCAAAAPARAADPAPAPPVATPAAAAMPAPASPPAPPPLAPRAGPFFLGLHVGPSFGLRDSPHQLALAFDVGFAVTPDRLGSVMVPVQLHLIGNTSVGVPLGFQYDVRVPALTGLYVYPRFSVGYIYVGGENGAAARHGVLILPEAGVKYVIKRRVHLGAELFSLPIAAGSSLGQVQYRVMGHLGVSF